MRKNIYTLIAALVLLTASPMFAQITTKVCAGETVCHTLGSVRGTIQWQESTNGMAWTNVASANSDTLCMVANANGYFRAEIVEGTCAPIYSEVRAIEVSDMTVDAGQGGSFCGGTGITLGGAPTASGGFGPYSYLWSPVHSLDNALASNPISTSDTNEVYTVVVTDSIGCTATMSVSVAPTPEVIVDAGPDVAACTGNAVVIGGMPAGSGGVGTLTYAWTPGTNLSATNVANPSSTPTGPITYYMSVTDSLGCVSMDTVQVDTGGSAAPGSMTFSYTGAAQMFIVPACIDSITFDVSGAQGGANWVNNNNFGGQVVATIAVTPGETLMVYVGQQPTVGTTAGWNGGGAGDSNGKGGGGASDVRRGAFTLNDRIVVGGGGGGAGYWTSTHVVGGQGGFNGGNGYRDPSFATNPGGKGATQVGPGADGTCASFNVIAMAGAFGTGGTPLGSNCGCEGYGGGGGWYGGAGSGNCRGAGGGSNYALPAASSVVHSTGTRVGNGQVILTW